MDPVRSAQGAWTIRLAALLLALAPACAAAQNAAAVAAPEPVQARGVEDPRAFVATMYAAYQRDPDRPGPDPSHAYSDGLRDLFAAYDAFYAGGDLVGALDFDWWTNAQEWRLSHVAVTDEPGGGDRKTITVRFLNYDRADITHFNFVRVGERWYLDDVVNGTGSGGGGWMLSALLRTREH
ncbi:MAG TPA: hypothetical protein VIT38_08110 [Allosphingosinicella sp.]